MKKIIPFLLLFLGTWSAQSQTVQGLQKGKQVGVVFYDANDKEVNRIEPMYDEIQVHVRSVIGGIYLGDGYVESRYWGDTEYVEVPIDPSDPTLTKVDTFINQKRAYNLNKPIIVKKAGKYGLINQQGNILLPFEYTSILPSIELIGYQTTALKPLLLMQKGTQQTLYDANLNTLISDTHFPPYFNKLNRKVEALELMIFGDNLLINEGGILTDSIVKVPAKKETVKGKVVVKEKAYSYPVYYYKGGNFNVLNLKTGALLWPSAKADIFISAFDSDGKPLFENLNPRNINSVFNYPSSRIKENAITFEFK
ncbi:MAG: hypothetical protein ACOVK9_02815 [Bacteroidia bacterium]|jgi:hypothetical protein